jgi:predicted ATP-dependent serine protease
MKTLAAAARRIARWTCGNCGHINPNMTGTCRMCGQ